MDSVNELFGVVQHYAWGSTTAIPHLLGEQPNGEPDAELWYGAHPKAPSIAHGQPLDTAIDDDHGLIGAAADRFGGRLPFLIKLLAAARPLSLQAHPSREQAETGFAREEEAGVPAGGPDRNYVDDWPKPEMLVALEPTDALCGFRDPVASADLLHRLGIPSFADVIAILRRGDASAVRDAFRWMLQSAPDGAVDEVTRRVEDLAASDDELELLGTTVADTARFFPGDRGVLAALLMNRVSLTPYQGIYLPAGNLHAYLSGFGVEILANSDNVLRGGLTPKRIDVDELISILDTSSGPIDILTADERASGLAHYDTPAPEFTLWRLDGFAGVLPQTDDPRVVLAIDPVRLTGPDVTVELAAGRAAFLPAGSAVDATSDGVAFVAAPGSEVG